MEALTFKLEKIVKASHDSLDDFEGPLDLILYLLSKNKIQIKDIQISEILDQYLDYLDRMKKMDLDIASDFVAMASHLLYIKVRMLLSIHDQEANEEMDMLIQTLEERRRQEDYRRIQYACQYLSERYAVGKDLFIRDPEPLKKNKKYEYRP